MEVTMNEPPWTVEGCLVDIVVDHDKKTMCLMVGFTAITRQDLTPSQVANITHFCQQVNAKLGVNCVAPWRVI